MIPIILCCKSQVLFFYWLKKNSLYFRWRSVNAFFRTADFSKIMWVLNLKKILNLYESFHAVAGALLLSKLVKLRVNVFLPHFYLLYIRNIAMDRCFAVPEGLELCTVPPTENDLPFSKLMHKFLARNYYYNNAQDVRRKSKVKDFLRRSYSSKNTLVYIQNCKRSNILISTIRT